MQLPNVANVLSIDEIKDGKVYLTANLDDKIVKLSVLMPCLISVDADINTPRLPSYKIKKNLNEDSVRFLRFEDFDDQDPDHYGLSGSATQVERIFPPEKNEQKAEIFGSYKEQAHQLYEILCNRKMI